jgi:hypothetical protein
MKNWTTWGIIALFVNLAFSLALAFWAIGLWYNHVDFEVEKKKRDEVVNSIVKTIGPGEQNLQTTRAALARVEMKRPMLQAFYQAELENLRTGKNKIQALYFVKGELQLDDQGRPKLGPILDAAGQEIAVQGSLKDLDEKYKKTQDDIRDVLKVCDDTVKEIAKLTELIGDGSPPPKPGLPGGLRFQLASWQLKEKRSLNEQEFVKPLLYNRLVELDLLNKRLVAVEARLKEAEGAAVTEKP